MKKRRSILHAPPFFSLIQHQIFCRNVFFQNRLNICPAHRPVSMTCSKFIGIIPEQISARVLKVCIVVHYFRNGLHIFDDTAGYCPIRLCRFCNIKRQQDTNQIVGLNLCRDKVAKRVGNRDLRPVFCTCLLYTSRCV